MPPNPYADTVIPDKLQAIIHFFSNLSPDEKRENLVTYSGMAGSFEPQRGDRFVLEDVRKDQECTDTVGIFLIVDPPTSIGKATFRVTLGPQVQTLTKAMTTILCQGLEGTTPADVLKIPANFVPDIVGGELVRVRSQTTYYILGRMKGICQVYLNRKRKEGM